MKKCRLFIILSFFFLGSISFAQIQLTGGAYTQDFNTLKDTGSSAEMPYGWFILESGTSADGKYNASTGSGIGGNIYSFGSSGSTERALGSIRSSSLDPEFGANFVNSSGAIINLLYISYMGEQWRVGTNRDTPDRLDFQYSIDATSLSDGNWTDVDQLDFFSPKINTLSGSLNGNLSENRTNIIYAITGLSISAGDEFWIKWSDPDASSSDDGLAIDDFSLELTPSQSGILEFKSPVKNLFAGTTDIRDTVQISGYSGQSLKAVQFNFLLGKQEGGLILKSIERGSAVPVDDFTFEYEIFPGSLLPDNSSIDTVKVVILGNNANVIPTAGSPEILYITYDIANVSNFPFQTFNGLTDVKGATESPVINANLTPGPDEIINISLPPPENKLGDLNLDNQVDLLDLLLMIDCILGREILNPDQFLNGDLFPWTSGEEIPVRDGIIDVLDLALLQNIILTGMYPDDSPVTKVRMNPFMVRGGLHKHISRSGIRIQFHFTAEGIKIDLTSDQKIKGLQIELKNIGIIPQDTKLTSVFNRAVYYQKDSFLRMLVYDDRAVPLEAGEYQIASLPFSLINPEDIVIDNIIAADENNSSISEVEIETFYENPNAPSEYMLSQNYPNPFNPSTEIKFSIPQDEFVTVKVFDILGREVNTLFAENSKAGIHRLNWNGMDNNGMHVSSGTYICRMAAGGFLQTIKMMYLK